MLYAFFWVIPRRLNFMCRRFGTLCSIFIGGYLSAYEDGTECPETSTYKIQTPQKYTEESVQHYVCSCSLNYLHIRYHLLSQKLLAVNMKG
jgi:hypothetical protein